MENAIIKGVALTTRENWNVGEHLYPSMLLTVAYSWIENHFDEKDLLKEDIVETKAREFGKIKATILAYTSDLHNISVNLCLLLDILSDTKISSAKRHLYSNLVLENYFTNLRSLLDFIPYIIRLSLTDEQSNLFPQTDSLNKLIRFSKNPNNKNKIPMSIHGFLANVEEVLNDVKTIRDLIIHKGKEILISKKKDNRLYVRIPKTGLYSHDNMLPNILNTDDVEYDLYEYLRVITKRVLTQTEDIGTILLNNAVENNKLRWNLYSVGNHCFMDFNTFMINLKNDTM